MKYLKTFEFYSKTGNQLDYEVGDTVISKEDIIGVGRRNPYNFQVIPDIIAGKKYKVVKIYSIPEDKFLKNPFMRIDVEDIETGVIKRGFKSTDFKLDIEFDADKYNL